MKHFAHTLACLVLLSISLAYCEDLGSGLKFYYLTDDTPAREVNVDDNAYIPANCTMVVEGSYSLLEVSDREDVAAFYEKLASVREFHERMAIILAKPMFDKTLGDKIPALSDNVDNNIIFQELKDGTIEIMELMKGTRYYYDFMIIEEALSSIIECLANSGGKLDTLIINNKIGQINTRIAGLNDVFADDQVKMLESFVGAMNDELQDEVWGKDVTDSVAELTDGEDADIQNQLPAIASLEFKMIEELIESKPTIPEGEYSVQVGAVLCDEDGHFSEIPINESAYTFPDDPNQLIHLSPFRLRRGKSALLDDYKPSEEVAYHLVDRQVSDDSVSALLADRDTIMKNSNGSLGIVVDSLHLNNQKLLETIDDSFNISIRPVVIQVYRHSAFTPKAGDLLNIYVHIEKKPNAIAAGTEYEKKETNDTIIPITRRFRLTNTGTVTSLYTALSFVYPYKSLSQDNFFKKDKEYGGCSLKPALCLTFHSVGAPEDQGDFWHRYLVPGLGFSFALLDFDEEDSIEIGAAVHVSLFRNLIGLGYGYNFNATKQYGYFSINPFVLFLLNSIEVE